MRENRKIVLVIISIALSILFLSIAIDSLGEVPSITDFNALEDLPINPSSNKTNLDKPDNQENDSNPDLRIYGPSSTNYLRMLTFSKYSNGEWETSSSVSEYYEEDIDVSSLQKYGSEISFTIEPLKPLSGYLPVAPYTFSVSTDNSLEFFENKQLFYSEELINNYNLTYLNLDLNNELLNTTNLDDLPEYLNYPLELKGIIQPLAEEITKNCKSSFEQLQALENYLENNYEYNMSFEQCPANIDPTEWFLFHSGEGVCIQFNTALTLMARSLDIPARLVGGYYIDSYASTQDVYPIQRHAFTEVPFEDLGWVIFDATPSSDINSLFNISSPEVDDNIEQLNYTFEEFDLKDYEYIDNYTVFKVIGETETPFLRNAVADYYNGSWYSLEGHYNDYSGVEILHNLSSFESLNEKTIFIKPKVYIKDSIPTMLYTKQLYSKFESSYSNSHQIFKISEETCSTYLFSYDLYNFSKSKLENSKPEHQESYLQLPDNIKSELSYLAKIITEGKQTPYLKLQAIKDYLKLNYKYNRTPKPVPSGYDPTLWFLFQEYQGNSLDFNTAFILLSRSIGIPARLVKGYLIDPGVEIQQVSSFQTHVYAEVPFQDIGWITFDATNISNKVDENTTDLRMPTNTSITYQEPFGLKGSNFTVKGLVIDIDQRPVDGLSVLVYLKQKKNETGLLCGEGTLVDGFYNITCQIPVNLEPGIYLVDVHTIGNHLYLDSWSDPPIEIYSETELIFEIPDKVITGRYFSISGHIVEKLTNSTLSPTSLTVETGVETIKINSDENGFYEFDYLYELSGNYPMKLDWKGSDFYLSTEHIALIESIPLTISPDENIYLVRNEPSIIRGSVYAEDLVAAFTELIVTIDGEEIYLLTDQAGRYSLQYKVAPDHPLGDSQVTYKLVENSHILDNKIDILARPTIIFDAPDIIKNEKGHLIQATLLDDLGNALADEELVISYTSGVSTNIEVATTNVNGVVSSLINLNKLTQGELDIKISYLGSGQYLPADASQTVNIVPNVQGPIKYLIIGTIGVIGAGFILYLKTKNQETKDYQDEIHVTVATRNKISLQIELPQIKDPLPHVWGINESLTIIARLLDSERSPIKGVKIGLTESKNSWILITDKDGIIKHEIEFIEKGAHQIYASCEEYSLKTQLEMKVVDYREEIISIFNDDFRDKKEQFTEIKENFTARELYNYLKAFTKNTSHKALKNMISQFEEATYSIHKITRENYVNFYLAKIEFEEENKIGR